MRFIQSRLKPEIAIAIALASGCTTGDVVKAHTGGQKGGDGNLSFYEPNEYPVDDGFSAIGFETPIAVGARADVAVIHAILTLLEGEVDDESVASIEVSAFNLQIRAHSEGSVRLDVTTADDIEDYIDLETVEPDGATIWVLQSIFDPSWMSAIRSGGYAMRPGAKLTVAAQPTHNGRGLLGFDFLDWDLKPSLIEEQEHWEYVNSLYIEAKGNSGMATFSTQIGGSLDIQTLASNEPPTLKMFSVVENATQPPEIFELVGNDPSIFVMAGFTGDGRYVMPASQDELDFSADVINGDLELLGVDRGGGDFHIRACRGSGTVRFSYMGALLDVSVEISGDLADPDCA